MRGYPIFIGALALAAMSCASVHHQRATSDDTEPGYRAFLATHPDDERVPEARARLEELVFQRAKRGDDIAAYNRFLAEFPEGDFADEAREHRAARRLARAVDTDDRALLLRVIAQDPGRRAAGEARARLGRLEARKAGSSDDPAVLRAYLLAFPEADGASKIRRRLDDTLFGQAKGSGGVEQLRRYLETQTRGIHRAEAQAALEELEADQAIATGNARQMVRFVEAHPGSDAEQRVREAAAEALVAEAEIWLDADRARRALELAPEGPAAERAEAVVSAQSRPGKRLAQIRRLVGDLAGPLKTRGATELRTALEADDPRQRWHAVREVALSADPETIDVAVEAAGSGDPLLLFYARTALAAWWDTRLGESEEPIRSWISRLRRRSSNPEDLLRFGALMEATGEHEAARRAYGAAVGNRATTLAAASHRALVTATHGTPARWSQALEANVDICRERLQELLDAVPDQLPESRQPAALQVLRGLEALVRVNEAVINAARPVELPGNEPDETAAATQPTTALDDLQRLVAAASAAQRRLGARLSREAPDLQRLGDQDPLTERATVHRRRRVEAARRLATLRAREAVPALVAVAETSDGEVQREALRALGRIATDEARAGLLRLARGHAEQQPSPQGRELVEALRSAATGARGSLQTELRAAADELERNLPTQPGPAPGAAPE